MFQSVIPAPFVIPAKAGFYEVEWDASGVACGIYYYRLVTGQFVATRKLVLLK